MNEIHKQPDWNLLRAFLATAEQGSLSAAARELGLTQPTLSRQVAALEAALGVMLFERVGRGLALTDAGRELKAKVQPMGDAARHATFTASALRSELSGPLRITASHIYSAYHLPAMVGKIKESAPQLRPEIVSTDDISDLMRREADIAVRHVRPTEPDLVARLVTEMKGYFYAAPALLARTGTPKSKAELAAMGWIFYGDNARLIEYMQALEVPLTEQALQAGSADGVVAWELAKAGLGVSPMDANIAALTPEMQRLLPDELEVTFPVWLVTHREIHTSPKIRLAFDMLAEAFAKI